MEKSSVPLAEIKARQFKVQQAMQQHGIDGLLVVQRVDLYYLSGTAQNGWLYLPAAGKPLLCIKRYLPRAKKESPLENIVSVGTVHEVPQRIIDYFGDLPHVLGLEFDVLPVREYHFYRNIFPARRYVDASAPILNARRIKSDWEINQLERTADMSRQTFDYMQTAIRPGISEMEFAGLVETFARKLGHGGKLRARHFQSEAYPWHVLSGENGGKVGLLDSPSSGEGTSAAFPSGAGPKLLASNEPILVDFGTVRSGYHIDETRMFAITAMPAKARKACEAAIEIHDAVIEKAVPGISVSELFEHSVAKAERLGYADTFLGPPHAKVNFVGHGIGLELIEPPFIAAGKTDRLQPGMAFALEPKMCFENEFAAGIESVCLMTENGSRLISKVPAQVFVCRSG